jgi:signal transduction histidine kinase
VIERWNRSFFIIYFSALMICCAVSLVDVIIFPRYCIEWLQKTLAVIESFSLSMPLPMLTAFIAHCRGKKEMDSRLFRAALALWGVFVLVLISTPFSDLVYYVAPDGMFYSGPLYWLMGLPIVLVSGMNLVGAMRWRKQLARRYFISFIISSLPLTVTLIINMFVDVLALVDISIVVSAISMFGLIVSKQIEDHLQKQQEVVRQQKEIADQRASVMVLQMRPHFIYNTLMSIYSLCDQDPQKARKVTMDFTNYLRKNFNAVASDTTIPFTAELEHTRTYLDVEKAQHEDMLVVDFDTPFTYFRLPPLTLQPLAENAVKHGMDPNKGLLHVVIRTRQTENGAEITVEDDGRGFDPAEGDRGGALENIRQRLALMCGGTLTIASSEGGGTSVTITIPDVDEE